MNRLGARNTCKQGLDHWKLFHRRPTDKVGSHPAVEMIDEEDTVTFSSLLGVLTPALPPDSHGIKAPPDSSAMIPLFGIRCQDRRQKQGDKPAAEREFATPHSCKKVNAGPPPVQARTGRDSCV